MYKSQATTKNDTFTSSTRLKSKCRYRFQIDLCVFNYYQAALISDLN